MDRELLAGMSGLADGILKGLEIRRQQKQQDFQNDMATKKEDLANKTEESKAKYYQTIGEAAKLKAETDAKTAPEKTDKTPQYAGSLNQIDDNIANIKKQMKDDQDNLDRFTRNPNTSARHANEVSTLQQRIKDSSDAVNSLSQRRNVLAKKAGLPSASSAPAVTLSQQGQQISNLLDQATTKEEVEQVLANAPVTLDPREKQLIFQKADQKHKALGGE